MQMITILKQNTSLHDIKYLYPLKCIPKKISEKTNKNLWEVHVYFSNIWGVQQNGMWALHVYIFVFGGKKSNNFKG
jgi:hypothetical protein